MTIMVLNRLLVFVIKTLRLLRGSMDGLVHHGMYRGGAQTEIAAGTQGEYGQKKGYQGTELLGLSFALDVKGGE